MENKTLFQRIEGLPVPAVATSVGAATLANVYQGLGFEWVRHITMILVTFVLIGALIKITRYFKTFQKEYSNVVPASLYATVTMLTMILSNYYFTYIPGAAKVVWLAAIAVHICHILIFTWNNIIKGVKVDTFVPSWFVTFNGLLVSTVVGVPMNQPELCKVIVIYGIIIFAILIPFMVVRMIKKPIEGPVLHTRAIVLAPSSLCLVGYLNFFETPNQVIVYALYAAVIIALVFIFIQIPKFFSVPFAPGFAGLTFPMAIGTVASGKMSGYLAGQGLEQAAGIIKEVQGIQIYVTTAIIAFVAFGFLKMLFAKPAVQ